MQGYGSLRAAPDVADHRARHTRSDRRRSMTLVRTVGHGVLTADRFATLVAAAGIDLVVDVRRFPGSRRQPHFGEHALRAWLPEHGVRYRWEPALGGRRDDHVDSPNVALRSGPFRGYADHMASTEFARGVGSLVEAAAGSRAVVMCSESEWTRCHRGLLADHLVVVEAIAVEHLHHDGRLEPHPSPGRARDAGRHLVYDVAAPRSLFGHDGP